MTPHGARVARRSAALCALLALAGGCTRAGTDAGSGGGRHAYTHPHELRYAVAEDISGLNPLIDATGAEMYLATLTMAFFFKTDARGEETVPELVTVVPSLRNGGIGADGKTLTFHLRRGVKWSDGAPFDADDVVFTTRQILNPATNTVGRDGWDQIVKVDEPDKFTVVYHLKAPYSNFAGTFFSTGGANPAVLPKHLLAHYANVNAVPYNALPVGIGPFKYAAWKRADSVVMVANPNYFRGKPKLERVVFEIIPDRNVVLEQLRSHELDLWLTLPAHYYAQAAASAGIAVSRLPGFTFDHLDFNLTRPALRDVAVRRALRFAIDRRLLNDKIRNGLSILSESPVSPASRYYEPLPLVPFDLARANALLDAAGWRRTAGGIRAKDGVRLGLTFVAGAGSPDADMQIELIRGWFEQIGVDVNVKRYLSSQLFALQAQGGILYGGKFDVAAFAWGGDPSGDQSNLYACYRFPPNGQNVIRWCDPAATAAMDAAKHSYDPVVRERQIRLVQRAVYAQVPTVVLDARRELAAYNADLRNWHPNPVRPFDDMMNVDI